MSTTIYDLVRESGISLATVSKYLNGKKVKDSTAKKIDEAIRRINYIPNGIARSLVTAKTRTVGVLLPFIANEFCSEIVQSFVAELRANGYATLICDCNQKEENEEKMARFLLEKKVDAMFSMPLSDHSSLAEFCNSHHVPIVFVDHYQKDSEGDIIISDNKQATFDATQLLLSMRHRKIAMIGSDAFIGMTERADGYFQALYQSENSATIEKDLYLSGNDFDGSYQAMKQLWEERHPTAVICASYNMTLGALYYLQENNIRLGEDISFIGFDSLSLTKMIYPPITTIEQQCDKMGAAAARLLIRRMNQDTSDFPQFVRIPTVFHQTDSIRAIL